MARILSTCPMALRPAFLAAPRGSASVHSALTPSAHKQPGLGDNLSPRLRYHQHSFRRYTAGGAVQDDVKWLFPAGRHVERMVAAGGHSMYNMVMTITLNSAKPLPASLFEEMLLLLQRKVPSLMTCFRPRGDILWICQLQKPKLDFKVVDGDLESEMWSVMKQRYDTVDGPLWRARLLPCRDSDQCRVPELRTALPHQYHLLLGFSHAGVDGLTVYYAITLVYDILLNLHRGIAVDEKPMGIITDPAHSEGVYEETKAELEKDPEQLLRVKKEVQRGNFRPFLSEAFGEPDVSDGKTRCLTWPIDASVVKKFKEKCAAAGVTLNSGLGSVVDWALVDLAREAGVQRDFFRVVSNHAVSMRRYWSVDPSKDFGSFHGNMTQVMEGSFKDKNEFWTYVAHYHEQFRERLRTKYPYQEQVALSLTAPKDFSYEQYFANTPPLRYDHFVSNFDVPHFVEWGTGDDIQVTDFSLQENITRCEFSNLHGFGRFRDDFIYNMFYADNRITKTVAEKMFLKVRTAFYDIAK